jgi:hypothetical protein
MSKLIEPLFTMKKVKLVCYAVDRFSRNISVGIEKAKQLLRNKSELVFVREGIHLKGSLKGEESKEWEEFTKHLHSAEDEINLLRSRVKVSIDHLKEKGYHYTRFIPYGFSASPVIGNPSRKKLIPCEEEQLILNFICLCRKENTEMNQINGILRRISHLAFQDPIVLECGSNRITDPITFSTIAFFLNDYNTDYRGKVWTPNYVRTVYQRFLKRNGKTEEKKKGFFEEKYDDSSSDESEKAFEDVSSSEEERDEEKKVSRKRLRKLGDVENMEEAKEAINEKKSKREVVEEFVEMKEEVPLPRPQTRKRCQLQREELEMDNLLEQVSKRMKFES